MTAFTTQHYPLGRTNVFTRRVARLRDTVADWDGVQKVCAGLIALLGTLAVGTVDQLAFSNAWATLAVPALTGAAGLLARGTGTRVAEVAPWYARCRWELDELARASGDAGHVLAALGPLRARLDDLNARWVTVRTAHRQLVDTYPAAFSYQRDSAVEPGHIVTRVSTHLRDRADWLELSVDPDLWAATAGQRTELADAYTAIRERVHAWEREVETLIEGSQQRARLRVVGVGVLDVPGLDAAREAVAGLASSEELTAIQASASAYLDAVNHAVGGH